MNQRSFKEDELHRRKRRALFMFICWFILSSASIPAILWLDESDIFFSKILGWIIAFAILYMAYSVVCIAAETEQE